jgi:hypothetical protein
MGETCKRIIKHVRLTGILMKYFFTNKVYITDKSILLTIPNRINAAIGEKSMPIL